MLACLSFVSLNTNAQQRWSGNTSPDYTELISFLDSVAQEHPEIELYSMGQSDYGLPIYVCIVNGTSDSIRTFEKARNETTVLIINAIHPGEPDGINAMLIWLEEIVKNGSNWNEMPVVAFIPSYNVGGMMNRSSNSRANQNGPEEYGFRGNAQNLDLNRDFIKMDSENAFTFSRIFHALDPDVLVDNHVSNGADYQYTLTYIASLRDRMDPSIGALTYEKLIPELTEAIRTNYSFDLFPYVDLKGKTPEEGIVSFNDLPRYSMGYASLFNTLSFTVETHMLKPFPLRVQSTYAFMKELINWCGMNKELIEKSREEAHSHDLDMKWYTCNFKKAEIHDSILFKGYEHSFPINNRTGLKRLYYDRKKPYSRNIPWYNEYIPQDSLKCPSYYVIGSQEKDVIHRLEANHIRLKRVEQDTAVSLGTYYVDSFTTTSIPYEGHFRLLNVHILDKERIVKLKKGDIIVDSKQKGAKFIHAVLNPKSEDSYLSWNFFDSYLQQKEYFSSYVFIDKIEEILDNDQKLAEAFEKRKSEDSEFRNSEWKQLYYIYSRSPFFEESFKVLPVYYSN